MNYLIDTNILIYFFNGKMDHELRQMIEDIFDSSFNISVVTQIEFLGWRGHTKASFQLAVELLQQASIY